VHAHLWWAVVCLLCKLLAARESELSGRTLQGACTRVSQLVALRARYRAFGTDTARMKRSSSIVGTTHVIAWHVPLSGGAAEGAGVLDVPQPCCMS
jgi:hypothetical protein